MIPIVNFFILVVVTILTLVFYWISVSPAALEKVWGEVSYKICTVFRFLSGIWMAIAAVSYVVYKFYPLPLPIPGGFAWGYGVSIGFAVLITIPSIVFHLKGIADAGKETMIPGKDHTLYKGIYKYIRHPQAVGEVVIWWTIALLLNSPFLALYSIIWIPVFIGMCAAEEKDLIIRYGKPYSDYRARTGMFFPKLSKSAGNVSQAGKVKKVNG